MGLTSLLDISRKALAVQTQAIRTTGDNIANVNTAGYTRRRVDMVTSSAGGSSLENTGVDIKAVTRTIDVFLNAELLSRASNRARDEVRSEILSRAETPFSVDNQPGSIGYQLNEFFSALQDLSTNPADVPLRTQVISKGQALADAIKSAYNETAALQREADDRIKLMVEDVNRLSSSIASLNAQISTNESAGGQEALTLRDQRDELLRQLSEHLSVTTYPDNNGQISVCLNNGFALVSGSTSRDLDFSYAPSFAPTGGYAPGLDGSALGHIVYSYSTGGNEIDLTSVIRSGSGEISGLLSLRGTQPETAGQTSFDASGDLVLIASRLESLSRDLLMRFNQEYQGGGTAQDLNGVTPAAFGLFSFTGATAANNFGDILNNGVANQATMDALVASGISNFSSMLTFAVTNERNFAAARSAAPGDDANAQALVSQRNQSQTYQLGQVLETAKIDDFIEAGCSQVGNLAARANDSLSESTARESQIQELQSGISGVNIDEEFANLIKFQRAYEASARMVRMADQLLSELIQMIGG